MSRMCMRLPFAEVLPKQVCFARKMAGRRKPGGAVSNPTGGFPCVLFVLRYLPC